ncbi:MAG TPA: efflux RND transporter periplasmic adaptor subunit, partial [Candidatus Acidoferrum sp.]|nr:efflux RND transporter periplasmic adaptor subunit [Candidatus Acidoferrum sp.]
MAVAPVMKQDVPVYLSGLGSVTAFNTANIKSRVDGQIMKVNAREGQEVHEGESLIEIDSRPYQVQIEQLQAQLFKDQASLRDAKLNLERYTALIPSGSIAQQQVDTQKALVDQLEGTVRNDQAQINSAKLNITYCHITAPFSGRVGLRQVDPGNIVHASDANPMLILTQLHPIAVIFTLPEDLLRNVAEHMRKATLEVDAFSRDDQTKLATGKLET